MGLTRTATKLSTKGQLVLPQSIRSAHGWRPGTEFSVEDRDGGVVLKAVRRRGTTQWEDLVGLAHYKGPRRTIRQMDRAIEAEAKRQR